MSYEGYQEYLCANGHYQSMDCYADDPTACDRCGAAFAHWHPVDQTNGVEDANPSTMPAPKEQIGADDEWHIDHHGNRYAVAIPRYRPLAEWKPLAALADATMTAPTVPTPTAER